MVDRQRILVAYYSLSNNTRLLANTLGGHLSSNHAVTVSEIGSLNSSELCDYDLILVGSPCHDSDLAVAVKNFLQKLPSNPSFRLAGFYSHSTYRRDDPHPRAEEMFDRWAARGLVSVRQVSIEKNIDLLGIFNCMGAPTPEILDFIHREIIPDEDEWTLYKNEAVLHPSKTDLIDLVDFADLIIREAFSA